MHAKGRARRIDAMQKIKRTYAKYKYAAVVGMGCAIVAYVLFSRASAPTNAQNMAIPLPPTNIPKPPPVTPPSEAAMRGTIIGIVGRITDSSLVVRTERPDSTGKILDAERTVIVNSSTTVTLMGKPKDPNVFQEEIDAYKRQAKAGATGGAAPTPSEIKKGALADIVLGQHIAVIPVDPDAPTPVAREITIAFVSEMPAAPVP